MTTTSHCDACGHALSAFDLVPNCFLVVVPRPMSPLPRCDRLVYPAIELAALAVALWAVVAASGWVMWATCLLGWMLMALAIVDWRDFLLPDFLTLPLLGAGLITIWIFDPAEVGSNLAGAIVGLAFVLIVRIAYHRLRGREGIGLGDAKLLAAAGAWVGWRDLAGAVLIGSLTGIATCLLQKALGDGSRAVRCVSLHRNLGDLAMVTWLLRIRRDRERSSTIGAQRRAVCSLKGLAPLCPQRAIMARSSPISAAEAEGVPQWDLLAPEGPRR